MRAVVLALLAGCMSPVMTFGAGKSAKQAQHDTMASFGPARLTQAPTWSGEITTRKIRVWADAQYRTQNRHWQQSFEEPLELANRVLEAAFGLRLVVEYKTWDRHAPGTRLEEDLEALAAHDSGSDVFAVVGLTSSLPLVSSTFEELGIANVDGRHVVLRGYADLEERKVYADAFPDLRAEERELALVQLRRHKTAVVLLHELGHILGYRHESDSATIMNAVYSNHASAFSPAAREVMLHTLDQRLARGSPATLPSALPTAVPAAAQAPQRQLPAERHAPIVIRVTKKAETFVDGAPVTAAGLATLLDKAFAEDPRTLIVISQDRHLPSGVLGDLLDRVRASGFEKVEFAWSGK